MKTVMSWQPTPMYGGASIGGVAITLAVSGRVERHCDDRDLRVRADWQFGPVLAGYDET